MTMTSKTPRILQICLLTLVLGSFFLLPFDAGVRAQTPPPSDDAVNQIAGQLFCPVCENVPLDECQTAACEQWRELIRQKLSEGWTEDEIKAFFVAQYGDRVLGEPPRRGANWLLYVLPPAVFVIGIGLLFSKLKREPETTAIREAAAEDPYLKKVEQDLSDMENA